MTCRCSCSTYGRPDRVLPIEATGARTHELVKGSRTSSSTAPRRLPVDPRRRGQPGVLELLARTAPSGTTRRASRSDPFRLGPARRRARRGTTARRSQSTHAHGRHSHGRDLGAPTPSSAPPRRPPRGRASTSRRHCSSCSTSRCSPKQLHWSVNGPLFVVLHRRLDELVDSWRELADTVASAPVRLATGPTGRPTRSPRGPTTPQSSAAWSTTSPSCRCSRRSWARRSARGSGGSARLDVASQEFVVQVVRALEQAALEGDCAGRAGRLTGRRAAASPTHRLARLRLDR